MNQYFLVLTILAIALGAMVYVVGMPWLTPRSRRISRSKPRRRARGGHR